MPARPLVRPLAVALSLATAAATVAVGSTAGPAAASAPSASWVVTTAGAPDAVLGLVGALGGEVTHVYRSALTGFAVRLPAAAVPALSALPGVAAVEPDGVVRATGTQSPVPSYGLDRIDQRALPLDGSLTTAADGAGVRAYVVDTGIALGHTDFGGRAVSGFDAVDGGPADDCNGHGTHVAGTTGGTTYGVAKAVTLVAVRVLDCAGSGATSGVIAGVDWVAADHAAGAPAVANMSLGGSASAALDTAVKGAIADGVTFAVAAGNDGGTVGELLGTANACNGSPSRVPAAITVGATGPDDARASYSSRGSCLDLFAPGTDITSAWYTSPTATNTISGTSMATPHVAGVAALFLSTAPSSTPAQVAQQLVSTATPGVVRSPGTGSPNLLLFTR